MLCPKECASAYGEDTGLAGMLQPRNVDRRAPFGTEMEQKWRLGVRVGLGVRPERV